MKLAEAGLSQSSYPPLPVLCLYPHLAYASLLANGSPGYSKAEQGVRKGGLGEGVGPSTEPSVGEHSLTTMDLSVNFLNSGNSYLALAEVGFGSPSLLGGQVGQELQLCLGILEDPVSTKKWAGLEVGLLPPTFLVGAIYLPDPPWLPGS